jgi:hypothetical protein
VPEEEGPNACAACRVQNALGRLDDLVAFGDLAEYAYLHVVDKQCGAGRVTCFFQRLWNLETESILHDPPP